MECRAGCGACCIAPSINQPFYGMPNGKRAGERCGHLNEQNHCNLFEDRRRPKVCLQFQADPSVCGDNFAEAIRLLGDLEEDTKPARS